MPAMLLTDKFEKHYQDIRSEKFRRMEALGGEVPFFISPYPPERETEVTGEIQQLIRRLQSDPTADTRVLDLDLYQIVIELLGAQMELAEFFAYETTVPKTDFREALEVVLEMQQVLLPEIERRMLVANERYTVYFVRGVGRVFPYIRAHTLLNNLQTIATRAPTVLFYPGTYTGYNLRLFNRDVDDNYYRAFNLDNYKV